MSAKIRVMPSLTRLGVHVSASSPDKGVGAFLLCQITGCLPACDEGSELSWSPCLPAR
jgi:hypothetical protein